MPYAPITLTNQSERVNFCKTTIFQYYLLLFSFFVDMLFKLDAHSKDFCIILRVNQEKQMVSQIFIIIKTPTFFLLLLFLYFAGRVYNLFYGKQ